MDELETSPAREGTAGAADTSDSAAEEHDAAAGEAGEVIAQSEGERLLLDRLREALIASDPEVDPSLVGGASLVELETSFAQAKAVAERLKGIVLRQGVERISPGAPGRTIGGPRTPFEKIREGLRARS